MWLVFGLGAIVCAALHWAPALPAARRKGFGFASLSLTALTMCAFYSDAALRVAHADWGGLMDILPTMSPVLWVCVIGSIVVNGIPLLRDRR